MTWIVVDVVHANRQAVCDHYLLEEPPQNQPSTVYDSLDIESVFLVKLRHKAHSPLDGARNQLGEEAYVEREDAKVAFRFLLTSVDIDRVAQRLKGIERNACRKQKLEHRDVIANVESIKGVLEACTEKVEVLEGEEHSQIRRETEGQPVPANLLVAGTIHPPSCDIVHERRSHDQDDELWLPAHIEIVAGDQEHDPTETVGKQVVGSDDAGQEKQKIYRIEEHGRYFFCLVTAS